MQPQYTTYLADSTPTLTTRFWLRVQKTDSCWLWIGHCDVGGYGIIHTAYWHNDRQMKAHRVSYEIHYGSFPKHLRVLHRCDNPRCVRPDHLFLGTDIDNIRDRDAKGRRRQVRGEQQGSAKVTAAQVADMRRRYDQEHATCAGLARQFSISPSQVRNIVKRRDWQHIC